MRDKVSMPISALLQATQLLSKKRSQRRRALATLRLILRIEPEIEPQLTVSKASAITLNQPRAGPQKFYYCKNFKHFYPRVGRAVTRSTLEREVRGSNLGPVKSDTVLPTARHRCNISSKGAVLPGRNDAEMGHANSLHASAYYSEYNERFDLKKFAMLFFQFSDYF